MSDPDVPAISRVTGTGVPIRGNDIDTDQIIPARFLKVVTFEGLGQFAFFDQRYDEDEEPTDHPMNQQRYQGATIMVVNANFGCGSSREHAPQALKRWGIDAIVGESFAEIFANNCLSLGIPTATADHDVVTALQDWIAANPDGTLELDLEGEELRYDTGRVSVELGEGQRTALVEGRWDTTALMRSNRDAIEATAAALPYVDGGTET